MRRWSGHSGSQGEANAGADSPRKRKSSKNRPDAHGVDQKELDTRISQSRRGELRPALPRAPALALSPLPDLTLQLSLQRPDTGLKAPPALGGSAMVVRLTGRQIFAVNGTAPARHDRRAEPRLPSLIQFWA